ncbi:hypothetical protein RDI58_014963 [Solanum bulbocastanum]|uniref:DUF4216 domain-containing protein n=1 Tax=Solanum bulbocastanum TaxID=147425 RepID=A0AAN8TDD2_SOLBU
MEENILVTTTKLEKIFPCGFFDVMEHLPIHLVQEARLGGPVETRWMYPFERRNRFNHNDEGDIDPLFPPISFFNQNGRLSKKRGKRGFTDMEMQLVVTHVLLNCPEIQSYVKQVYDEYSSVQYLQLVKEVALGPESQVLTMNKYCANGFKFQTEEVSRNKKTNNSGVYIQGDIDGTGQIIEYYGVIQEIIEVRYSGWPKKKIVLFRCEWFDPSHRGTKMDHQHNIIELKHTRKYRSYDPFIIAQNAKQVYYASYPLHRDKVDWWVVIKKEVSDDDILNVEEEVTKNKENESFDDEKWDDNENETTEEEEKENDGIETSEEE